MARSRPDSSKTPRHVYKEMKEAGASKKEAADMARESISKRRVPPSQRPNDERTREEGG